MRPRRRSGAATLPGRRGRAATLPERHGGAAPKECSLFFSSSQFILLFLTESLSESLIFLLQKAAIKKMDMQATTEFLAELKVLTNVHHLNLITRGLEYIHEHTVPVYIHRDIKSANILINKNFRAKVADFGLAKLTEVGASLQTRLVGTFGYMPPEYAQYGEVSPKVDVYAFRVVLYEFISAKDAIVKTDSSAIESRGLVALVVFHFPMHFIHNVHILTMFLINMFRWLQKMLFDYVIATKEVGREGDAQTKA